MFVQECFQLFFKADSSVMFRLVFDITNDLFGGGLTDTKTGKPTSPLKLIGAVQITPVTRRPLTEN